MKTEKNREKTLRQFEERVKKINEDICLYRSFVPLAKPLIEKYAEYFNGVSIGTDGSISLTPVDSDKIPPLFFCEALEIGILAREYTSSYSGMGGYGGENTTVKLVLNKC